MTRPNVLWIGADQLRFDTLSSNGNPYCRTPHLDTLVEEGVNFDRAYTTCSLCSPARASMLTGLYAFKHGMGTNCDMYHFLAPELTDPSQLLHHHFKNEGYRCAFAGKWHVGTEKGPGDYGFEGMSLPGYGNIRENEEFKDYLKDKGLEYKPVPEIFLNPDKQTLVTGRWGGPQESTPSHYLADRTIEMMDDYSGKDEPFFITCQFWGPHGPHMPSDEFYGLHDPGKIEPWKNFKDDLDSKPRRIKRERDDFYRDYPDDWSKASEIVARYYDCTAMLDFEVGRMLSWMEENNILDNTIIVFSTDHGDMTASHGGLQDKGLLYEETQHIPLMFYWKGHLHRGARKDLALNMDIIPTLMDLCSIPIPQNLDGISLQSALYNEEGREQREEVLQEFHGLRFLYSQRAMVSDDNWKYIFTPGDYDEVYDLNQDPDELNNLIDNPAAQDKIEELRNRLRKVTAQSGDPLKDCVSKFFGVWRTGSGQIDATSFFDDSLTAGLKGETGV